MDEGVDFDHHAERFAREWRAIYGEMRSSCPVARTPRHGGFYVITRADDVVTVLRDTRTYSSGRSTNDVGAPAGGVTIPTNPVRMGLMEMDAPEHTVLRRRISAAFSRGATAAYRPRLRELVTWCVDRVVELGHLDVVDDLANPLPCLVTLDVLGLPLDRWHGYARALHEAVYRAPGSMAKVARLLADLEDLVASADASAPGVLGMLKRAQSEDSAVGDDVIVELLYMLLSGGVDTTTALIASSLLHLSSHPDDRARLQQDPTAFGAAVQELIRYYSPATGVARTVTEACELSGVPLMPGDRVLLALGAANTDPARVDDPDAVIIAREENPHLSFGTGAHRCIGAELASVEMEVLLEEVLRRMPDLAVDADASVPYPTTPLVKGYVTMPGSFRPGEREGADGELPVLTQPRAGEQVPAAVSAPDGPR